MEGPMMTENQKLSAVYVSWTTFNNAIASLTDVLPNRIDKTVFGTAAGGVQAQLLTGLRFLGLITTDGKPTEALRALAVKDEAERKKQIAKILKASYPDLFALDLAKATPGELREQITKSYGVSGDTTDRAIRFFIAAAEYADIPLSTLISKGKATSNGTRKPRRAPKPRKALISPPPPPSNFSGAGESKSVKLTSGGTLTISASLGFFKLSQKDRAFVFELIDKLDAYAEEHPQLEEKDQDEVENQEEAR
jgi:Family of unknown function (DUF5343)